MFKIKTALLFLKFVAFLFVSYSQDYAIKIEPKSQIVLEDNRDELSAYLSQLTDIYGQNDILIVVFFDVKNDPKSIQKFEKLVNDSLVKNLNNDVPVRIILQPIPTEYKYADVVLSDGKMIPIPTHNILFYYKDKVVLADFVARMKVVTDKMNIWRIKYHGVTKNAYGHIFERINYGGSCLPDEEELMLKCLMPLFQSNVKLSTIWENENAYLTISNIGQEINYAPNIEIWKKLCDEDKPAYCYYQFNDINKHMGLIYNYAATRELAPDGYRIPNRVDFDSLQIKLKKSKSSSILCRIIVLDSCNKCSNCSQSDYDTQLNFNLKPIGWLAVSKSNKIIWTENGNDMYLWFLDTKKSNSVLSGLGLAQFNLPVGIRTVKLNEINNLGSRPENVKKEDFEYIEKYFGTFVRLIKQ